MSQYDTGMGWSADALWLFSGTGEFARAGGINTTGPAMPELPVTDNPDVTDIWANGLQSNIPIWAGGAGTQWSYKYMASAPGVYFYHYTPAANGTASIFAVSADPSTILYYAAVAGPNTPTGYATQTFNTSVYFNVPGGKAYYFQIGGSGTPTATIPNYVDAATASSYFSISTDTYYKLNAGWAVTCVAKWITPTGTTLISPVLISSASLTTALSKDGTTPASDMTTFSFLRDGLRFYMSIIGGNTNNVTPSIAGVQSADLTQFAAAAPSKVFSLLASSSFANIQIGESPDPYTPSAEEEGGDGEDIDDDPVDEETMPLPSVAGLGFCTVYVPSQTELLQMASYLWSGNFDVDQVIKLFSNPLDSIIGLSAVPVDLVGTSEQIYLGGVALTGVTMPRYTGRTAVKVDMGSVTINKRYGSYLDYDPYTEFAIYVPFVGIKNLKADDIMGKTLSLMYDIDILTGACVAYLRPAGGSVLYEWAGQCAQQIPVTSANWDNIFRNALTAAATLGTSLFAPASAPVLSGAVASAAVQTVAAKPRVERSGALTGVSGWLGQLRPYIIRTIPEAFIPEDQNKFVGYPAYINVSMSGISGYNEVASVHLEGIPATGNELAEIESLLKGGVIF